MDNGKLILILERVIKEIELTISKEKQGIFASGICGHVSRLYIDGLITRDEKYFVRAFVLDNKPNEKKFTKYTTGRFWTGNTFWWIPISQDKETAPIRISFLKDLIRTINV